MDEKLKYYISKTKNIAMLFYWRFVSFIYFFNTKDKLGSIIKKNREYIDSIDTFITPEQYKKNDYGIPGNIYKNIDKPINNNPTYSDLIIFLMSQFSKKNITYLEIGVSVMKNFMQINNHLRDSTLVAYDINEIINTFSKNFEISKDINTKLFLSNLNNNIIYYYQGDVLSLDDTSDFSNILNLKYDFVMSDAMHTKEGIVSEFKNIIEGKLSDEFILYYDDLDFPELEEAAKNSFNQLSEKFDNLNFYTFWISGWVGQNEKMHKNGLITNMNIEQFLNEEKIKLPFFKKLSG